MWTPTRSAAPLTSSSRISWSRRGRRAKTWTCRRSWRGSWTRRSASSACSSSMSSSQRRTAGKLAMRLNALLASRRSAAWTEGQPLDIESLLRGSDGRPGAAVLYIAHLSDAERQGRRGARPVKAGDLDEAAVGQPRLACARVSRRSLWLRPTHRPAAHEARAPDVVEAGSRPSVSVCSSPRRTQSTWTTRRCRTRAHG